MSLVVRCCLVTAVCGLLRVVLRGRCRRWCVLSLSFVVAVRCSLCKVVACSRWFSSLCVVCCLLFVAVGSRCYCLLCGCCCRLPLFEVLRECCLLLFCIL